MGTRTEDDRLDEDLLEALGALISYLLGQGFYNFCLSIAVFFFVAGYWIRNRDRLDFKRGALLAALGLLLYACHLFSLMMACAVWALPALVATTPSKSSDFSSKSRSSTPQVNAPWAPPP